MRPARDPRRADAAGAAPEGVAALARAASAHLHDLSRGDRPEPLAALEVDSTIAVVRAPHGLPLAPEMGAGITTRFERAAGVRGPR
ncbi:hypothetical protein [Amycolatopsis sacchari]|uniref:hypothetical protein n=1 Tax=Amycolatopsis sacchari TaxID=115433 RepID=UPI003EBA1FE4